LTLVAGAAPVSARMQVGCAYPQPVVAAVVADGAASVAAVAIAAAAVRAGAAAVAAIAAVAAATVAVAAAAAASVGAGETYDALFA